MKSYVLTVFDKKGEKLLDEQFEAQNDEEAKSIGKKRLIEKGYNDYPHRCATSDAKLILFKNNHE